MRTQNIIELANRIKNSLGTKNPFEIAEYYDIRILFRESNIKDFKAQTLAIEGYPTIISINDKYTDTAKMMLCAHELGHALLHKGINYFNVTEENIKTNVEYEANLFAVALLFEQEQLSMRLDKMANSTLKSLLDYNIS